MKIILNFIFSIILIEVGFYLFFGNGLNINNTANLNNYHNEKLPDPGTMVELYVIDVGELFLTNDNYSGVMYDSECYYIVQINDGRFFVVKVAEGSLMDEKLSDYAEKYKKYYYFNKGEKPEILCIDGKIDTIPELENGTFDEYLLRGKRDMMQKRRYVRMEVNETVINVDTSVSGQSMNGILKQSLDIVAASANALKKMLGVVVVLMGVVLIFSNIKDMLSGISFEKTDKNVILADNNVFNNISTMKTEWNKDDDVHEETYDEYMEKIKDVKNFKQEEKNDKKGFKIKKEV